VERLRELFAGLIGATADGVALVPATSYGFAVAARALGVGPADRVLVLAEEYPSGVYTWRAPGAQIVTVERGVDRSWTQAVLEVLDGRISVVSVPNVHWTDGAVIDLAAVADRGHAVGARLVIDGSQSVGAMPLDVAALRPDFVVSVGYKWLLGPFGIGYLDVGQRTKFELVPMAVAALEQLTAGGVATVAERLAVVTEAAAQRAVELGLDATPAGQRGPTCSASRFPTTSATPSCPRSPRPTATPPSAAEPCGSPRTCTSPSATSTASSRHSTQRPQPGGEGEQRYLGRR
jgi:selenocysteine lyase/cysteine desulfurase